MKNSVLISELPDGFVEHYHGATTTIRNHPWLKQTGCPLNNKQLKFIEKELKKNSPLKDTGRFESRGSFGTRTFFYWEKSLRKFVLFSHEVSNPFAVAI